MLLKNILKQQKLDYLSWQYIFYHLKYEKGFKVTAFDIKNSNLKTPIIEYLYSKEFEQSMYRDIEYNTREKLILENKERIMKFNIDKKIQSECSVSYYIICSTLRYLRARFDISVVTDRQASLAHVLPVLGYIINKTKMNGEDKDMSSTKMYQIDLKKLLADLDLTNLNKKEQAEKLGFTTYNVYVNITLHDNYLTKRSLDIIANTLNKHNLNIYDYIVGDASGYYSYGNKPTEAIVNDTLTEDCCQLITDDGEELIAEPKITDNSVSYELQQKLYKDTLNLKNMTNETQEQIILNQLSDILEIIKTIINK